ncbi:transcriptional regulator [Acidianus manzaensis]|uniref:Transcriptional regulator n=1 Tax=Acidianus manzaensis TaxID=282676 RepID=A0A1W6JXQ8_9CREN|nr:transcriptional regulator [Acidianus manzaensis]ARM75037.1 transcriptional regulator [Acidianus manzaensis]
MEYDFLTTRERIFYLLKYSDEPLTARQIMKILGIKKEKEVYEHLYHISKSSKRKDFIIIMFPPICENCGYTFKLETPKKPSRCPICKSERIKPPSFLIRNKNMKKDGKSNIH